MSDSNELLITANDMELLRNYVDTGIQLPITDSDYIQKLNLDLDTTTSFRANIERIVKAYGEIRKHTHNYKYNIHQKTTAIASHIIDYAEALESLLKGIESAIKELGETGLSPPEVEEKKKLVDSLIDEQITLTRRLLTESGDVGADLGQFESETRGDEDTLKEEVLWLKQNTAGVLKMKQDLESLISKIGPAIHTIEIIKKVFYKIYWGLKKFEQFTDEEIRHANATNVDIIIERALELLKFVVDLARQYVKVVSILDT